MAKTAIRKVLLCIENNTVHGISEDIREDSYEVELFICEHLTRVAQENCMYSDIVDEYEDEVSMGDYTWSASEVADTMGCLDEIAESNISENLVEEYCDFDFCDCSSSYNGARFVVALEVIGEDGKARYFWDSCILEIEDEPELVCSDSDKDFNAWISYDCEKDVWYVGESDPEPEPEPEPEPAPILLPMPNTRRLMLWVIKFTENGIPYTAGHEDFGQNVGAFENAVCGLSLVGNIINTTKTSDMYSVTFAISN